MGRRIRTWKENGLYHATYECSDRMFMLKPSREVNELVGSWIARAAQTHPVQIHAVTTNINHLEIIFSIGPGQIDNASRFQGHFAGHLGQALNSIYDREGHFWSGRARVEEILTKNN